MKIISFFNEKGGVGKSTFTIMYASWLKYKHGINVGVADFNNREEVYRKDEIEEKRDLGILDNYDLNSLWPIVTADRKAILNIKNNKISPMPNAHWLENEIHNGQLKGLDVLIVDLPGASNGREFMEFLISKFIGLYAVIFDRDPQTMRATMTVRNAIAKSGHEHYLGFINQAQSYVAIREYEEVAGVLMSTGLPILPDIISYSERMKKISEPDIMRSTMEYPDWNNKKFEGSRDLGTENLFIDITRELMKVKDFKGTPVADLSFINDLQKTLKDQEKRQLIGSSFPEYEFPVTDFPKDRQKAAEKKD